MNPFLELWLGIGLIMTGIGLAFALLGVILVAMEGRKGWPSRLNFVIVMFPVMGFFWPIIMPTMIGLGIYRAVKDK